MISSPRNLAIDLGTLHGQLLFAAGFIAICMLFPRIANRIFNAFGRRMARLANRRRLAIVAVFCGTILVRLALLPVFPVPTVGVHDEFSYLLQADTFAHGRLANPPHPMWVSFETFHENWFPTYSGMFPPAQSAALALGELAGSPWIGVLLSDALMCAVVLWMLQGWFPPRWALLGVLMVWLKLGIISYWMNSYWGGAVAAAGGALLLGALPRIRRKPDLKYVVLFGLGLAILANSRPYEGLLFSLPATVVLLVWMLKHNNVAQGLKWRRVAIPLVLIAVMLFGWLGYYNRRLTGHPLLFPHTHNWNTYLTTGLFLWDHDRPEKSYRNLQLEEYYNDWARENYERSWRGVFKVTNDKYYNYRIAYFWPGGVLLLVALPCVVIERKMRLMTAALVLVGLGLFCVVWSLPHYAAPLTCVFFALLLQCARRIRLLRVGRWRFGRALVWASVLLLMTTVAIDAMADIQDPANWNWNGDMGMHDRASVLKKLQSLPGKQLAIVRYGPDHDIHQEWVYNAADIDDSKVVWAREVDADQNRKLLDYYKDRTVWLIQPEDPDDLISPYSSPEPRD